MITLSAVASLLFGGAGFCDEFRRLSGQLRKPLRTWPFLLGHLAAFAGFAWLTGLVLEGGIEASPSPGGEAVAWAMMGLATAAFWAATALPIRFWIPLARRGRGALALGLAVGLASWWTGQNTRELWLPFHRSTFWLVNGLLGLVFPKTVCRPDDFVLGTPSFMVAIERQCSGYEGVGLIWVFLGAYLWFFRRSLRFPRALLLLPLGTILIWMANALRIAALVAVGTCVSPAVALGGFHSQAGWLAFLGVGLGLVTLARRAPFFGAADSLAEGAEGPNPTAAHLAPFFAILGTALITGAFSSSTGFDRFYPLRVLAAAGVLGYFRRSYAGWAWTWSWEAVAIGVGVFAMWMALEPASSGPTHDHPIALGLMSLPAAWAEAWLFFRIVGAVVTVPLAEELAFRGFLMRRLIAADFEEVPIGRFSWWSFLASSALFGFLHGRWFAGMLAGMLYALALYRRRAMADAILAHATTNALIAVYVLTTDTWSLWD